MVLRAVYVIVFCFFALANANQPLHVSTLKGFDDGDCINSPCETIPYAISRITESGVIILDSSAFRQLDRLMVVNKTVSIIADNAVVYETAYQKFAAIINHGTLSITGITLYGREDSIVETINGKLKLFDCKFPNGFVMVSKRQSPDQGFIGKFHTTTADVSFTNCSFHTASTKLQGHYSCFIRQLSIWVLARSCSGRASKCY